MRVSVTSARARSFAPPWALGCCPRESCAEAAASGWAFLPATLALRKAERTRGWANGDGTERAEGALSAPNDPRNPGFDLP